MRRRLVVLLVPLLAACPDFHLQDGCFKGELCGDAGAASDAGADAGFVDSGATADAGVPDSGTRDAGPTDAGTEDAGVTDAGVSDSGPPDAGMNDAGASDAGSGSWHIEFDAGAALYGISGDSKWGVWAVGDHATFTSPNLDGQWTAVDAGQTFVGVWVGTGPLSDEPYAAATDGHVWEFNGTAWYSMGHPTNPNPLVGLWGDGSGVIWAVYSASAYKVYYNGSAVTSSPINATPTGLTLHSVWADSSNIWIAGKPALSSIARAYSTPTSNPGNWTPSSDGFDGQGVIFAIWGDTNPGGADIVTVGEGATLGPQVFWNFSPRTTDAMGPLHATTGEYNSDTYWAGGEQGTLVHWDSQSGTWPSVPSPTTDTITGMWTPDGVNVWAVTDGGLILRYP